MKPIVTCKGCGTKMSIDEALLDQIRQETAREISREHREQLEALEKNIRDQVNADTQKKIEEATQKAVEQSSRKYLQVVKDLQTVAEDEKNNSREQREQLTELMTQLREAKRARDNAELEMQKKLAVEEMKIRADAEKTASEKHRLHLAEREKTIADLSRALEDAQRKASQGSQQLQGEILELDIEKVLISAFHDDEIEPVAKGIKGGDIRQIVKNSRGTVSGVILWEVKRTKNWSDGWIQKVKDDVRAAKANVAAIITEVMPKGTESGILDVDGVWVCKPHMTVVLATLLRKGILDVGRERSLAENRGVKADALYSFVTSHEFVLQIEAMVEIYDDMIGQLTRERTVYEGLWSKREQQAQSLLFSTASIIGAMQGQIGQGSMPRIKGLELSELGVTTIVE